MGSYAGVRVGINPTVGNDIVSLQTAANEEGKITNFNWGGGATASTAMRFRVARPATAGVTGASPLTAQKMHPIANAALVSAFTAWTTQPVLTAGEGLYVQEWNAHGGIGRWLAAPGEEIALVGAGAAFGEISFRAEAGTALSSYGVIWAEP